MDSLVDEVEAVKDEGSREPAKIKVNSLKFNNKTKSKAKSWADKVRILNEEGFSREDINDYKRNEISKLQEGGFTDEEIKLYFGDSDMDLLPLIESIEKESNSLSDTRYSKKQLNEKYQNNLTTYYNSESVQINDDDEKVGFLKGMVYGAASSATGHLIQTIGNGEIDEDHSLMNKASWLGRLGHGIGTVGGDYPFMIPAAKIGAAIGGATGAPAGPIGVLAMGLLGATVGGALAFALPSAVRKGLVEWHGTVSGNDNDTFFQKLGKTFKEAGKDVAVGAISGFAGGAAKLGMSKALSPVINNQTILKGAAATSSLGLEAGIASTSGALMHTGELPEAQDFIDNFMLMAALHHAPSVKQIQSGSKYILASSTRMVSKANKKMKLIFEKHGEHPADVRVAAEVDPQLKLDLISESNETPRILKEKKINENKSFITETGEKIELKKDIEVDKINKENKVDLTPLEEAKSKIDEQIKQVNKDPKKETFLEKIEQKLDEFQYNYLNEQHYVDKSIEQLTGQPAYKLSEIENPTEALRNAKRTDSLVEHSLLKGAVGYDGSVQSKGLVEIVTPLKTMGADAVKDFSRYITAKRALEIESQNKKSGFDKTAAELIVKEGDVKFGTIAKDLVNLQNAHLKRLADSGFISEADYTRMVETNQSYVPFQRIGEDGQTVKSKNGKAVKGLKGSDQAIQDPLLSIIDSIEHTYRITEKNRAAQRLIDIVEKHSDPKDPNAIIRRVKTPAEKMSSAVSELNKNTNGLIDIELTELYKSGVKAELKDNQFVLWRNGKMEVYETRKEIAQLFGNQVTSEQATLLFSTAKALTNFKKKMITIMPTFMARNIIKDQVSAWVTKESKSVWGELIFNGSKMEKISSPEFRKKLAENTAGMDVILAMADITTKNENYFNYLRHFGSGEAGIIEEYRKMFRNDPEVSNILKRSINVIAAPIKGVYKKLDAYGDLMEKATRLAQAKKVLDGGINSDKTSMAKAARVVRESTVDFQQMGAKMNALNGIISFLNPHVQGLRKTAALVQEKRYDALVRSGVVATASLALWWLHKEDDRYKNIPQNEKDLFWHIITDDWVETQSDIEFQTFPNSPNSRKIDDDGRMWINHGKIYKIPKPPDIGLFMASLPVRLAEYIAKDNPKAFDEFGASLLAMVTPNTAPDVLLPIVEHSLNKNIFTGRAVVPAYLENASPEFQYTPQTTETAKQLGTLLGYVGLGHVKLGGLSLASPLVLENYIQSLTGSAGPSLLKMIDRLGRKVGMYPEQKELDFKDFRLEDWPIIGSFITRYPSMGAKSIQDATKLINEFEQIQTNLSVLKDSGDWTKYEEYALENREKLANVGLWKKRLQNATKAIEKMYRLQVNEKEGLSALQKRQLLETVYSRAIDASKLFLRQMESVEQEMKERKNKSNK